MNRPARRQVRRVRAAAAAAVAAAVLAGCGAGGATSGPTWLPQPDVPAEGGAPASPSTPATPGRGVPGIDAAVVATGLRSPTGLTVLPNGDALVGERGGRIVQVQPVAGRPVVVVRRPRVIVDAAGDGGLLDLAVSPTYVEDSLVYAYVSTRRDNRVIDLTVGGAATPVVTGLPHARTGNVGRLLFDASASLLIATGTATGRATGATGHATAPAGSLLRVDQIGRPVPGNPGGSRVFARDVSAARGLCSPIGSSTTSSSSTPIVAIDGSGTIRTIGEHRSRLARLPARFRDAGGCAFLGDRLWVTSLRGQALLSAPVRNTTAGLALGSFTISLHRRYGRLRTVVAAPDGSLWLTTANREAPGRAARADDRVLHLTFGSSTASSV